MSAVDGRVPLRYGDSIVLLDDENLGFLQSSPGFGPEIFVDKQHSPCADGNRAIAGMHECAFVLIPPLQHFTADDSNKIHALEKLVHAPRQADRGNSEGVDHEPDLLEDDEQARLQAARNHHVIEAADGREVRYGDVIQLQHKISDQFLTAQCRSSSCDSLGFQLHLQPGVSSLMQQGSRFCMLPESGNRRHGDVVMSGASIFLASASFQERFLNVNHTDPLIDGNQPIVRSLLAHSCITHRLQVTLGLARSSCKIKLFSKVSRRCSNGHESELVELRRISTSEVTSPHTRSFTWLNPSGVVKGGDVITLYNRHYDSMMMVDQERNFHGQRKGKVCFMPRTDDQAEANFLFLVCLDDGRWGFDAPVSSGGTLLLQHLVSGLFVRWQREGEVLEASQLETEGNPCHLRVQAVDPTSGDTRPSDLLQYADLVRIDVPEPNASEEIATIKLTGKHESMSLARGERFGSEGMHAAVALPVAKITDLIELRPSSTPLATIYGMCSAIRSMEYLVSHLRQVTRDLSENSQFEQQSNLEQSVRGADPFYAAHHLCITTCRRLHQIVVQFLKWLVSGDDLNSHHGWRRKSPVRAMQLLLLQNGALEALCHLIREVFVTPNIPETLIEIGNLWRDVLRPLGQDCFSFVTLMVSDNDECKAKALAFVPDFQMVMFENLGAYDCLMELFKTKASILEEVSDNFFEHVVSLLRQERRPDLISMLHRLCIDCLGQPVTSNQDRVLRFFFEKAPELLCEIKHSLPTMAKDPFTSDVHISHRNSGGREVSGLSIKKKHGDKLSSMDEDVSLFNYYIATMELMNATLKGRNWKACKRFLDQAVHLACRYNDLLFLVKHEKMPFRLRAVACELMGSLFVDRAPFLEVEPMPLIRVWSKLFEVVREEPIQHFEARGSLEEELRYPPNFKELRQVVLEQFEKHSDFDANHAGQTLFLRCLSDLTLNLTRFGGYHTYDASVRMLVPEIEEMRLLTMFLCAVLDRRTESVEPDHEDDTFSSAEPYFRENSDTHILIDVKIAILNILSLFWESRHSSRVTVMVQHFEDLVQDSIGPSLFSFIAQTTDDRWQKNMEVPLRYASDVGSWRTDPLWSTKFCEDLFHLLFERDTFGSELVLHGSEGENENSNKLTPISKILLNLATHQDANLAAKAMHLLYLHFDQRRSFVEAAIASNSCVRLISSERLARLWFRTRGEAHRLQESLFWLHNYETERSQRAVSLCTDLISRWAGMLGGHSDQIVFSEMHHMLLSLGVHNILSVILQLSLRRVFAVTEGHLDTAVDEKRRELLGLCHELLQVLCVGHPAVQEHFFPLRAVLKQHLGIVGIDAAGSLRALVLDNTAFALQVGMDWIELIFSAMMHYKVRKGGWLRALQAVLVCNGEPIEEHQRLVSAHLLHGPHEFLYLMKDEAEWDSRIDMLISADLQNNASKSRLDYHVALVNTLATCTHGSNREVEVEVATTYTADDIMNVLIDIDVKKSVGHVVAVPLVQARRVKAAFLKLYTNLYVDANVVVNRAEPHKESSRLWGTQSNFPGGRQESFMELLLEDISELRDLMEYRAGGNMTEQPAEEEALQHYVMNVGTRFLEAYYSLHYDEAQETHAANTKVRMTALTETLFDNIVGIYKSAVEGNKFDENMLTAAQNLIKTVGGKCRAREDQMRYLEFQFTQADEHTIRPKAQDSQTLLSDLMRTGLLAFGIHIAEVMGFTPLKPSLANLSAGSGLETMTMMLISDAEVPLERSTAIEVIESEAMKRSNPSYAFIATHFLRSITKILVDENSSTSGRPHNSLGNNMQVLSEISTALLQLDHPSQGQRSASSIQVAWEEHHHASLASKDHPSNENLRWVQKKYADAGAIEMASALLECGNRRLAFRGLQLLGMLLDGGNRTVQDSVLMSFSDNSDSRGYALFTYLAEILIRCEKSASQYTRIRKDEISFSAKSSFTPTISDSLRSADLLGRGCREWAIFGPGSEVFMALKVVEGLCVRHEGICMWFHGHQLKCQSDVIGEMVSLLEASSVMLSGASVAADSYPPALVAQLCVTLRTVIEASGRSRQERGGKGLFVRDPEILKRIAAAMGSILGVGHITASQHLDASQIREAASAFCQMKLEVQGLLRTLLFDDSWFLTTQEVSFHAMLGEACSIFFSIGSLANESTGPLSADLNAQKKIQDNFKHAAELVVPQKGRISEVIPLKIGVTNRFAAGLLSSEMLGYVAIAEIARTIVMQNRRSNMQVSCDAASAISALQLSFPELSAVSRHRIRCVEISSDCESNSQTSRVLFFPADTESLAWTNLKATGKALSQFDGLSDKTSKSVFGRSQTFRTAIARRWRVLLAEERWFSRIFRDGFVSAKVVTWIWDSEDILNFIPRWLGLLSVLALLSVFGVPKNVQTSITSDSIAQEIPLRGQGVMRYGWFEDNWEMAGGYWEFSSVMMMFTRILAILQVLSALLAAVHWCIVRWPAHFLAVLADLQASPRIEKRKTDDSMPKTRESKDRKGFPSKFDGGALGQERYQVRATPATIIQCLKRASPGGYHVLFTVFALLGAVYSPLYVSVYAIDFFRSSIALELRGAVFLSGVKLMRLFFLSLIVLLLFSLYAFTYFPSVLQASSSSCESLWQCTMTFLVTAIGRDNTELLRDQSIFTETPLFLFENTWAQFRTLFLVLFLVVWGILLQGFIFAQILDSFAEMRSDQSTMKALSSSRCFLCGGLKPHLQEVLAIDPGNTGSEAGSRYSMHLEDSYLLFLARIIRSRDQCHSLMENDIRACFKSGAIDFLPPPAPIRGMCAGEI